jgi:hypothetical protein
MSGSGGSRDDTLGNGGATISGGIDPCQRVRRGPINSPKASVLSRLTVGSTLRVDVEVSGATPILAVFDGSGEAAGSLTFIGYWEIIDCIQNRGVSYEATIINISGGIYEVRVEPN